MSKNECMINSTMQHSFEDNAGIYQLICFMKNKYYLSKLMLLNFLCQKILCKHNPFIHEKDSQLKLDTKVFMKAFHVS